MQPEFKPGDIVTFWPGDRGLSAVVLDVYTEGDVVRYDLIEAPSAKPWGEHARADTTGVSILESKLYRRKNV